MQVQLQEPTASVIKNQVHLGHYQSPEEVINNAIEFLVANDGIEEGLKDIEAGRSMELKKDKINEILTKPINQW